jgi:hypothetical protein
MFEYTVTASWNDNSCDFEYVIRRNGTYVATCITEKGAIRKVNRIAKKAGPKRAKREKELRDKYPRFPLIYKRIVSGD